MKFEIMESMAAHDWIAPKYAFDGMQVWARWSSTAAVYCRVVCAAGTNVRCVSIDKTLDYDKWWSLDEVRVRRNQETGEPVYESVDLPRTATIESDCPYQRIAGQIQELINRKGRRELRMATIALREEQARKIRKIPMAQIPECEG
jgi:hypothetical protein